MIGKVHSIETFGTLDGPGVRTVVFLQGCPNRCKFCHNPDSVVLKGGTPYTVDELVAELLKNKAYWVTYSNDEAKSSDVKGGVTFSGGEPLMQSEFLTEVAKKLKSEGVHVVVDTSSNASFEEIQSVMPYVDLWMISVKQMFDAIHQELVGVSNVCILDNIKKLDEHLTIYNADSTHKAKKQIRIRFVIIPGITNTELHLKALGEFVKGIKNLETMELLPYSTIGRSKWIELFGEYHLEGVPEATRQDVEQVKSILSNYINKFHYVVD